MPKISTDRCSSSRRSARAEGDAARLDDAARGAKRWLDAPRIYPAPAVSAARTQTTSRPGRLKRRSRSNRRHRRGFAPAFAATPLHQAVLCDAGERGDGRAHNAVEMHMPERHRDLQRQRRKREQRATPFMAMNPPHAGMLTLQCYVWQEGPPPKSKCGGDGEPHRERLDRMQHIIHHAVLADRAGGGAPELHIANRLSVFSSEPYA